MNIREPLIMSLISKSLSPEDIEYIKHNIQSEVKDGYILFIVNSLEDIEHIKRSMPSEVSGCIVLVVDKNLNIKTEIPDIVLNFSIN